MICDHTVTFGFSNRPEFVEVVITQRSDDWEWIACPQCKATWNYRIVQSSEVTTG
jgi:hypothetical protein